MSPWSDNRRRRWPVYAGLALIVLGIVAGYLLMTGADGDGGAGRSPATPAVSASPDGPAQEVETPDPTDPDDAGSVPILEVVSWGRASGQLAVEVRNRSTEVIEELRVRITALDESGATVVSTTGSERDVCCTVVGLPPGRSFGLFAELGPSARDVAAVEVEPVSAEPAERAVPRVAVRRPRLERRADDTVVVARLAARGRAPVRYVAVQAFLAGPDGRVSQVISGRFCLGADRTGEVRLHLFHPVPRSLRLDRVVAYALPPGVRPHVPWRCR
ncbi:hypothetical protein [Nocardioides sp. SYSU DS0651]|uniref:hypothetical protein n=1 Tax=Nocardioides sp. SYSU DS0651 TaxID=3415955 RepID=UPI003F4B30B1